MKSKLTAPLGTRLGALACAGFFAWTPMAQAQAQMQITMPSDSTTGSSRAVITLTIPANVCTATNANCLTKDALLPTTSPYTPSWVSFFLGQQKCVTGSYNATAGKATFCTTINSDGTTKLSWSNISYYPAYTDGSLYNLPFAQWDLVRAKYYMQTLAAPYALNPLQLTVGTGLCGYTSYNYILNIYPTGYNLVTGSAPTGWNMTMTESWNGACPL